MSRIVVLWSGGIDSTIVLHQAAIATWSKDNPVIALSVRAHSCGPKDRFKRQTVARTNYIRFAKRIGLFITAQDFSVTGTAWPESNGYSTYMREYQVFGAWMLPFLQSGDIVCFGYYQDQRIDIEKFNDMFSAYAEIAKWKEPPSVRLPLDVWSKRRYEDFIRMSLSYRIPRSCVYSCHYGENPVKCICPKCDKARECTIPDKDLAAHRKTLF